MLDKSSMHRLIGAGVMLVAAVSILPIILDGEKPSDLGSSLRTSPPTPEVTPIKIQSVQKLPTLSSQNSEAGKTSVKKLPPEKEIAKRSDDKKTISESKKVSATEKKPVKKVEAVKKEVVKKPVVVKKVEKTTVKPARWVVQIASFKNPNNAKDLVKKLQASNYAAYSITTKTLHKVFVGPEIKRSRSETIKQEIKKKFQLEGFVVKYSEN